MNPIELLDHALTYKPGVGEPVEFKTHAADQINPEPRNVRSWGQAGRTGDVAGESAS